VENSDVNAKKYVKLFIQELGIFFVFIVDEFVDITLILYSCSQRI